MLGTRTFYVIWISYACAASAGFMIVRLIAQTGVSSLAILSTVPGQASLVSAVLIGNLVARPFAGMISDRIGRPRALFASFASQAILVEVSPSVHSASVFASGR